MAIDQYAFGVLCLVRVGDCPSKMPDHEIEALKAMIDGHGYVRLPEGQRRSGQARRSRSARRSGLPAEPFGGMRGLYAGMSTKDRERVLLNLLGGQRPVSYRSQPGCAAVTLAQAAEQQLIDAMRDNSRPVRHRAGPRGRFQPIDRGRKIATARPARDCREGRDRAMAADGKGVGAQ